VTVLGGEAAAATDELQRLCAEFTQPTRISPLVTASPPGFPADDRLRLAEPVTSGEKWQTPGHQRGKQG
jgi:hypothetical protein